MPLAQPGLPDVKPAPGLGADTADVLRQAQARLAGPADLAAAAGMAG
jgi:hypothetical protein